MSRIATLTLAFNSELENARRAYDDFAAYVEGRTLKIPVEWQQPSSGAPGSPTAPPSGSPPSAPQATFGGLVVPFPVLPATPPPAPVRATPTANPLADATTPVITRTLTEAFAAAAVESARQFSRAPESYAPARLPFLPPAIDEDEPRPTRRRRAPRIEAEPAAEPAESAPIVRAIQRLQQPPQRLEPTPVTPIAAQVAQAAPAAAPVQPATRLLPAPPTPIVTPTPPQFPPAREAPPALPPPPPTQPAFVTPPPEPPSRTATAAPGGEGPRPIPVTARRVLPTPPPPPPPPPEEVEPTVAPPAYPPPLPGGRGFLRAGRLRQYATAGFLLGEASRIGAAFVERDEAVALSAGNLGEQLQAERRFQETISSTPFVGRAAEFGAAGIAESFGFGPIRTALTERAATLQDQRGRVAVANAAEQRQVRQQTEVINAGLAGGSFDVQRAQVRQATENAIAEAVENRGRTADLDAQIIANAREQARQQYLSLPSTVGAGALGAVGLGVDVNRLADAAGNAAVFAEQTRRAASRDAALRQATQAAQALERARLGEVNKNEIGTAIQVGYGTQASRFRAANDPVRAQLADVLAQNAADFTSASANLRPAVLIRNAQRYSEFFQTLQRQTRNITEDVQSATREVEHVGAGNTLGAAFERIRREEQQALREVPHVAPFLGINLDRLLGFGAQRDAIREQADAQRRLAEQDEQRRQVLVQGDIEAGRLRLRRQPLEAALAQSSAQTQAALTGLPLSIPSGIPGVNVPNPAYLNAAALGQISEDEIRRQRADERDLRLSELGGRGRVLGALLKDDRAGAEVERIRASYSTEALAAHQRGDRDEEISIRALEMGELKNFQNQYGRSFRAVQIDPLDFAPQNARDVEDPAAVYDKIKQAMVDAAGDMGQAIADRMAGLLSDE